MGHWAGTLQSGWFYKHRQNDSAKLRSRQQHPFVYLPVSNPNNESTFPRFEKTRVRFPAELLTWRNGAVAGQGHHGVKAIDAGHQPRSPMTVAGIAMLFFCCSITASVALGGLPPVSQ